jgi:hypothetical protein
MVVHSFGVVALLFLGCVPPKTCEALRGNRAVQCWILVPSLIRVEPNFSEDEQPLTAPGKSLQLAQREPFIE